MNIRHGYHLRSVYGHEELYGTALTGGSSEFDNQMPKAIDAVQKCMKTRYSDFNSVDKVEVSRWQKATVENRLKSPVDNAH